MPYIDKKQSPKKLLEATNHLGSKIQFPEVWEIISYSDGLYMYSDEKASLLKSKFQILIENHKEWYSNLIKKNKYLIPSAFSFITWSQLILEAKNFQKYASELRSIYQQDSIFAQHVHDDILSAWRKVNSNTVNYILEEILMDYLVSNKKVRLQNDYIQDREEWVLNAYSWKPLRSHVYLYQKNILHLESFNIFRNSWYDLENKKMYDLENIDIDTFDFR